MTTEYRFKRCHCSELEQVAQSYRRQASDDGGEDNYARESHDTGASSSAEVALRKWRQKSAREEKVYRHQS